MSGKGSVGSGWEAGGVTMENENLADPYRTPGAYYQSEKLPISGWEKFYLFSAFSNLIASMVMFLPSNWHRFDWWSVLSAVVAALYAIGQYGNYRSSRYEREHDVECQRCRSG